MHILRAIQSIISTAKVMAKQQPSDTTALTTTKAPKSAVSNLALGNADDSLKLARELQRFVKENKLTSNIQGKEFPNVEAWQFAGGLLGLSSLLESTEERSTETEIKWHATVKVIHLATGNIVGRGFATCSNKESTKKFFADYAICSMAQTRAVGKAYRLALGWLMKAAGFEATPAEEMSEVGTSAEVVPEAPAAAPMTASTTAAREAELPPSVEGAPVSPRTKKLIQLATEVYDADAKGGAGYEQRLLDSFRTMSEEVGTKVLRWLEVQPKKKLAVPGKAATKLEPSPESASELTNEFRDHPTADDRSPVQYATAAQKDELDRLCAIPVITRPEKTVLLLNINRLDTFRADDAIRKLTKAIEEREGGAGVAAVGAVSAAAA
jgi:hypothetical protein